MAHKGTISMLSLFESVPLNKLTFLTPIDQLKDILLSDPLKPENLQDSKIDPNTCLITKLSEHKKKSNLQKDSGHWKDISRHDTEKEYKQKVYKKGPFAEFYELNEAVFDKDAQAWYYKEGKQIIGPVSSYNMDKMVYHKTITGQTRVAFKSVDKFVKFSKIEKALEDSKSAQQAREEQDTTHASEASHPEKQELPKEQKQEAKAEASVQQKKPAEQKPKAGFNINSHEEFPPL